MELRYCPEYAVEIGDAVDVRVDGCTYDGEVVKIHPRRREVIVRYEDYRDLYRTTGNPRRKTARVPVADVDLIARPF